MEDEICSKFEPEMRKSKENSWWVGGKEKFVTEVTFTVTMRKRSTYSELAPPRDLLHYGGSTGK